MIEMLRWRGGKLEALVLSSPFSQTCSRETDAQRDGGTACRNSCGEVGGNPSDD